MLVVETIARIRREYFVKGKPIKEIVRDVKVSRNTVRKVIRSQATAFTYDRRVQPMPKLGPWTAELERMLEANETKSKRERLTLLRISEALEGLGYGGGYDAVRRYAKAWRWRRSASTAQTYVPLVFSPGEAYQFDWSHEYVVRAVQRSLLRVIAEQPVESADGISISRVGHVGDVVGAHDVGGETADASEIAGVFADATGVLAHGDITRIVVPVFNPPVCPDGAAGGVGGEHGVRHVVGGFAGQVPEAGRGVAFEAAAVDPNDGGDKGCPFGVAEMGARIEDLDVARLVSRPRGVDGLMAVERLALVA